MKLALFDLDHTLITFDSGLAWTRFLCAQTRLPAEAEEVYLGYARQYVAGTLNILDMHRACLAPLLPYPRAQLMQWAKEFEDAMAPRITAGMRALVQHHRQAGDLCAVVTATESLVAAPMARLFDVPHLVATEAQWIGDRLTGEVAGTPCFREHKVTRVAQWLASGFQPPLTLQDFERSWFYSDSISDLPLLEAVTDAVAVRPDARLRAHALAKGWPVLEHA